jgi:hypothetical protein
VVLEIEGYSVRHTGWYLGTGNVFSKVEEKRRNVIHGVSWSEVLCNHVSADVQGKTGTDFGKHFFENGSGK